MGQRIEVCRAGSIAHSQLFLTCGFEARIVTLALCPQGVSPFKVEAAAVNGKPVVIGKGLIFRAAPVFLAVVPILVAARANTSLRLAERAAVFLPGTPIVGRFAVLVHGKPGLADQITGRKRFQGFRAAWIEGNKSLALIDCFYGIVQQLFTGRELHLHLAEGCPRFVKQHVKRQKKGRYRYHVISISEKNCGQGNEPTQLCSS